MYVVATRKVPWVRSVLFVLDPPEIEQLMRFASTSLPDLSLSRHTSHGILRCHVMAFIQP